MKTRVTITVDQDINAELVQIAKARGYPVSTVYNKFLEKGLKQKDTLEELKVLETEVKSFKELLKQIYNVD